MAKKKEKKWRFFWEEPFKEFERTRRDMQESIKSFWLEPLRFEFALPKISFLRVSTGAIKQTNGNIVVRIPLPGFKKDEIDLNITESALYVRAEKKRVSRKSEEGGFFGFAEQSKIERSYSLPEYVDPEKVKAKLENGILTVILQKVKMKRKKKKVEIE